MTKKMKDSSIPAINLFVTPHCNMKCRFCFGKFENSLSCSSTQLRESQLDVIRNCVDAGIKKITFVGGEPLLCPWLEEIVDTAHKLGLCTCVVTNSYLVTKQWIDNFADILDWIGFSIDSLISETNLISGRSVKGFTLKKDDYRKKVEWVHGAGIKLKINTTVSKWNYKENMSDFFRWASPDRLKVFQVLKIEGINNTEPIDFTISDQDFYNYVKKLRSKGVKVIAETASDMKGSYLMVSPDGRFFENIQGIYRYSSRIQDTGFIKALSEINVSADKFHNRGGLYSWN